MSLLSSVTRETKPLPPRIVLYAAEKFGKTSWACHAWKPVFLMSAGETGLLSLLEAGRVPAVDHFPDDFQRWSGLLAAVRALRDDPHDYRTAVFDTGNGCEQLCAAATCDERFNGDWSEYMSYGRGNEQAAKAWAEFLRLLDELRLKRRMAIILLQHAKVKTFQDPAGKDWDQWRPEAIEKLWALTHKWADCILFGGFKVQVKQDKAIGESRYLRAEASGPVVAGNRYGLPAEITAAPGAPNLWKAFAEALARAKKPAATSPPPAPSTPTVQVPPPKMPDGTLPRAVEEQYDPDEDDSHPDEDGDAVSEPTPLHTPADPQPAPEPQAAPEPAGKKPESIGGDLVGKLLAMCGEVGIDWGAIRADKLDANLKPGGGIAAVVGFAPRADLKCRDLTAEQGVRLYTLLKGKVDEKARRARPKAEEAKVTP